MEHVNKEIRLCREKNVKTIYHFMTFLSSLALTKPHISFHFGYRLSSHQNRRKFHILRCGSTYTFAHEPAAAHTISYNFVAEPAPAPASLISLGAEPAPAPVPLLSEIKPAPTLAARV